MSELQELRKQALNLSVSDRSQNLPVIVVLKRQIFNCIQPFIRFRT